MTNRRHERWLLAVIGAVLVTASVVARQTNVPAYPDTRKVDQVDTYHGAKVPDPYRWLEDDNSPETAAWVEAQNKVTFPLSREDSVPRSSCQTRVIELNDYEKYSAPSRKGPYFFFSKNDGLQNQSVLLHPEGPRRHARSADRSEHVVDGWHRRGSAAFAPSKDAKYAVYGISQQRLGLAGIQGDGARDAGRRCPTRSSGSRCRASPGTATASTTAAIRRREKGKEKASINENHQVYFHKVGTPQSDDALVYRGRGEPAALPHRRHDRGRALRDPDDLGARQGQGRQRAVRPRSVATADSEFTPLVADDRRRHVRRHRQRRRQAARRDQPRTRRTGASCWSIRSSRTRRTGRPILPEKPEPLQGVDAPPAASCSRRISRTSRRAPTSTASTASSRTRSRCRAWASAGGFGGNRRRHVRVLHLQLAQRAADDLPLRHRDAEEHASSAQPKVPGYDPDAVRDEAGLLHEQGRHARSRCSSCTRRA